MARGACARGRANRLRSLAAHPRLGEKGEGSARQPRRRAGAGRAQPDRRNLDRPSRSVEGPPRRPVRPACGQVRGREAHRDRRLARQASRRRGRPVGARLDRLGVQHSRRRRDPHAASLWRMRSSTPTAPPICSSRARRSGRTSASISAMVSASTSATAVRAANWRGSRARPCVVDPERAVGRLSSRRSTRRRRQDPAAARPDDPPQGAQEPGRDRRRRRPRSPATARPSPGSSTGSTRKASARVEIDELIASDKLEVPPPRETGASRPLVRQHFGRRPERRDRPLQVEREDQPQARDGHALPDRFGRPICRRHHRHHPHRADRRADRGDARPLHPGAQGPHRHRAPRSSRRARAEPSSTASPARPLWEAGLDYAHGTGHGVGSFLARPRGAAAHRASRKRPEPAATSRFRPA